MSASGWLLWPLLLRCPEPFGTCRVLDPAERPAYAALLQACHGLPAAVAAVVAAAFVPERPLLLAGGRAQLQTFAAGVADTVPVATITALLWQPHGPGAQPCGALLWLGTHPAHRRQGHGTQVTAAACRWLRQQGAARLHVQASMAALSIYQGLGFAEDGWLELWGCGG